MSYLTDLRRKVNEAMNEETKADKPYLAGRRALRTDGFPGFDDVPFLNKGKTWEEIGRPRQRCDIKKLIVSCEQASTMSLGGAKHKPAFCLFKK